MHVAGESGCGKTSFLLDLARRAVPNGFACVYLDCDGKLLRSRVPHECHDALRVLRCFESHTRTVSAIKYSPRLLEQARNSTGQAIALLLVDGLDVHDTDMLRCLSHAISATNALAIASVLTRADVHQREHSAAVLQQLHIRRAAGERTRFDVFWADEPQHTARVHFDTAHCRLLADTEHPA